MKLCTPPLLYAASLGLFGFAAWTVCEMLPTWKQSVREQAHRKGHDDATSLRMRGREQGPRSSNWVYAPAEWWQGLRTANLTGWLPAPPVVLPPGNGDQGRERVVVPLAQLIELVSLVHDGETAGKGGSSHVVVRFKPGFSVATPGWWVKENTALPGSRLAANEVDRKGGSKGTNNRGGAGNLAKVPSPAAIVQKLWAEDGGDPRRSATLWPIDTHDVDTGGKNDGKNDGKDEKAKSVIGTIRLVRVDADAQRAFFERQLPPAKPGEPAPPPTEEVLIKTEFGLSQDLLLALAAERDSASVAAKVPKVDEPTSAWIETKATTRVDGAWHIGTDDEARFRGDPDRLLETLDIDTYSGRDGTKGLIVRSIEAKLGEAFGIARGDVLLEINGRKVESKAKAWAQVERDHERGVSTFRTRWLSNGQFVDRTYQARGKTQ